MLAITNSIINFSVKIWNLARFLMTWDFMPNMKFCSQIKCTFKLCHSTFLLSYYISHLKLFVFSASEEVSCLQSESSSSILIWTPPPLLQGFFGRFLAAHLNCSWRFLSFFGFWLEFFSEFGLSFEFFHKSALEFFFSVYVSTKPFMKSAKNWMVVQVIAKVWIYLIFVLWFKLIGQTLNIE